MNILGNAMLSRIRVAALAVLSGCAPLSCGSSPPDVGQFGAYAGPFKLIRLPSGDTLTVYRVKAWAFADGAPPALQLEYQTRVSIADTLAVKAEQRRLWPVFRAYVDQTGLSHAILTATDRDYLGNDVAHVSQMHHFGTILARDAQGTWRFRGDSSALPASVLVGNSAEEGAGIFERNGASLDLGRK
jgi:hypothetical protein